MINLSIKSVAKQVATVAMGIGGAQAIALASSPLLTRIFTPEDFGAFAVVMSITSLTAMIATLKYDLAILIPKSDRIANLLLLLTIFCICALSPLIIIFLSGLYVSGYLAQLNIDLATLLIAIPIATILIALFTASRAVLVRHGDFRILATALFVNTVVMVAFQISFGLWLQNYVTLVLGLIIGRLVSLLYLNKKVNRTLKFEQFGSFSLRRLRATAKKFRRFPLFSLPSGLVETASFHIPNVFLATIGGPELAGSFYLMQRVLQTPISLVANSVMEVFRSRASRDLREFGNMKRTFKFFFLLFGTIMLVGLFIMKIAAEPIIVNVFGTNWQQTAVYAQIMIPAMALNFLATPLSQTLFITQNQKLDLWINAFQLAVILSGLYFSETDTIFVTWVAVSFFLKYTLQILLSAYCAWQLPLSRNVPTSFK